MLCCRGFKRQFFCEHKNDLDNEGDRSICGFYRRNRRNKMGPNIHLAQRYIYTFLIFLGAVVLYLGKSENKTVVLSLYAVLACLMLIHHWYYRKDIHSSLYKYFLISELCIGFTLQYFDNTPFSGCYILFYWWMGFDIAANVL